MTHVFALTGGIGSGKSTVARIWREVGLAIVDADELARVVVQPGTPGLARLVEEFGVEILDEAGELNRAQLAALVFRDATARSRLNSILHPLVRDEARARFDEFTRIEEPLVCYEVPLLFETNQQDNYRPVVVVKVPLATQIARAMWRDSHDEDAVRVRVAAQLPLEEKVAQADFVIDNSGSEADTRERALEVLKAVRAHVAR